MLCLTAMGISLATQLPDELDEFPPIRDLEWNGADPGDELVKILDQLGRSCASRVTGGSTS